MGKKVTVEVLVDGGKATAGPALGGTLGPLRINMGQVIAQINEKTRDFKDMKVPVKITVDEETKAFTLLVGTPPAAQLLKKEVTLKKASGEPNKHKVDNLLFEQVIKVAKMKQDALLIRDLKSAVKTMLGTCQSCGFLVDGKEVPAVLKEVDAGQYDSLIHAGTTEASKEKIDSFKTLRSDLAKKREIVDKEKAAKKAAAGAETAAKPVVPAVAKK